MRVYIASLMHETNVFSPIRTNLESYREGFYYLPEDDPDGSAISDVLFYGEFYDLVRARGHEVVRGTAAGAQPSGLTSQEIYESLRDRIINEVRQTGRLDFVALYLHGAQMAQGYDDCEGDLLEQVAHAVGADVPVGAVLDLHGNITDKMMNNATCLVACKEYPHIDFPERIPEMLDILERTARAEIKPMMSRAYVPVMGNFHTTRQPLQGFVSKVKGLEQKDVLSISMMHGFAYADSPDVGGNMIVVTDGNGGKGQELADELGREFFQVCQEMGQGYYVTPDEAIDLALASESGPVVIADIADNPGGGAAGDSTFILKALLERKVEDVALGMLWDPVAVMLASRAGVSAELELKIGGKVSRWSSEPVIARAVVTAINESSPSVSMSALDSRAALQIKGVSVVVNSIRDQVYGPSVFASVGIDVRQKQIVVVKSAQHFHEEFAPLAGKIIYCNTPGNVTLDFESFPYQRIVRPMWPLDEIHRLQTSEFLRK